MYTPVSGRARRVAIGPLELEGLLEIPDAAFGLIVLAHASGASRLGERHAHIAAALHARALGTLQLDLLSDAEAADRQNLFDVELLGERTVETLRWIEDESEARGLPIGLFGAGTGAPAALIAAAAVPRTVRVVVARGGRPDLADAALRRVRAPTLLIACGADDVAVALNRRALVGLTCEKALEIVPGATHRFAEPGALERVSAVAGDWFVRHLDAA